MGSPMKRLKSQVEEDDDMQQGVCCGICYAEHGVSIAGEIDSCKHYFCFVCIMEWAKHESRCPICRQRFSNVRRLPMDGVFSSSRDVKVPLRDQVYHPYGNMSTGPVDSYADAKCSICHVGKDENLLLLCDLCDAASHTYCVGLGYTIPEGDWFCHDCAISRETIVNEESDQQNVEPTTEPSVTIFDIVRETSSQVVRRPRASPLQQNQSSPSVIPLPDRVSRFKGKNPVSGVEHMQRNIEALRENWNALRSGSLQFSCNSFQSSGSSSQKQDSTSLSRGKSDDLHSRTSTGLQQSTVRGGHSSNMLNDRGLKDVDKAWKTMDKAKMKLQIHRRTSSIPRGVDNPSYSGAREISSAQRNYQELKNQQPRKLDFSSTRMEKQCDYSSLNKNLENRWSPKLGEKRQSRVRCEEMIQHSRDHITHSEGYFERPLPRNVQTSIQGVTCCEDGERNVAKEQRQPACLVTSVGSAPSRDKFDSAFSSNKDVDIFNEEKRAKGIGDGNARKIEEAKTEIRSLVKLNLKFLTRDKQLGVETFKLVARQATHTILDACCSEQQKSNISPSSSSVCSHTNNTQQFQKSTLMPNCCRQCFYVFVNNVVNSIMLEKVGC